MDENVWFCLFLGSLLTQLQILDYDTGSRIQRGVFFTWKEVVPVSFGANVFKHCHWDTLLSSKSFQIKYPETSFSLGSSWAGGIPVGEYHLCLSHSYAFLNINLRTLWGFCLVASVLRSGVDLQQFFQWLGRGCYYWHVLQFLYLDELHSCARASPRAFMISLACALDLVILRLKGPLAWTILMKGVVYIHRESGNWSR